MAVLTAAFVAIWTPAADPLRSPAFPPVGVEAARPDGPVELPSPGESAAELATPTPVPAPLVSCTPAGIRAEGCNVVALVREGGPSRPGLIERRAVVLHDGGHLVRRELPGGDPSWKVPLPDPDVSVSILYAAGDVFVAGPDTTWRLDGVSGAEVWSVPTAYPTPVAPTVGVSGDLVELLDVSGRLTGLDRADGTERWSVPDAGRSVLGIAPRLGVPEGDDTSVPAGADGLDAPELTLGTEGRELVARRVADGLELFRASADLIHRDPMLLQRDGEVALVVFGADGADRPARPFR